MIQFRRAWYFFAFISTGLSCQEPWTIESPMIKPGSFINFKNRSSVGTHESLTWTWLGPNGEVWENRLWLSRNEDANMGGSFDFKQRAKHKKEIVSLNWEKQGNETKWNYDSRMIKQPGWKISVRNVIEVNFIPLENDWVFKVGEDQLFGTGVQSINEEEDYDYDDEARRRKRSPQFLIVESEPTEASFGSWMEKIMNFFFGNGESARGESEGIFSRLGNWLRGISCSLHGPCDQPVPSEPPSGPFPPPAVTSPPVLATARPSLATVPPLNPDAEVIPELNDV